MVRYFIFSILIAVSTSFVFCNNKKLSNNNDVIKVKDSIIVNYNLDVSDTCIINTTNRKVDFLINNSIGYLGKTSKEIMPISFNADYVFSNNLEVYNNDLLFEKQLLITPTNIIYFKKSIKTNPIKRIASYMLFESKLVKFKFREGNGRIKFNKVSCNDTDLGDVTLNYDKGFIKFKKIINPAFFEYDLDKNGKNEQYIIGIRNCSQELIILRVRE